MKNLSLLFLTLSMCLSNLSYSQWVYKTVDNGFDPPYKIAYVYTSDQLNLLKLERTETEISLYVDGGYHCEDYPIVDVVMKVGGQNKSYKFVGSKSTDSETVFFMDNILSSENSEFLSNFKLCSKFSVRINESYCTDDYYDFSMSGSGKAVDFMSKD